MYKHRRRPWSDWIPAGLQTPEGPWLNLCLRQIRFRRAAQ
jgi:hypothetical protein